MRETDMPDIMADIEHGLMKDNKYDYQVGDTVKVHVLVKEGEKERIQIFQGIVIAEHNGRNRSTFTVRKISGGVGVERVFPCHSPYVKNVEIQHSVPGIVVIRVVKDEVHCLDLRIGKLGNALALVERITLQNLLSCIHWTLDDKHLKCFLISLNFGIQLLNLHFVFHISR